MENLLSALRRNGSSGPDELDAVGSIDDCNPSLEQAI